MSKKVQQRRKKVLELLANSPISSTQELATQTGVTTETMRKDLEALVDEQKILKVHGGVALANPSAEFPFDLRAQKNTELKVKIAKAATSLIHEGDSILMESCTTCLELAKFLVKKASLLCTLIVFTNSLEIASLLSQGAKCKKLFFLGGWVNLDEHSTQGHLTTEMLKKIHVNKAFISGAAINDNFMISGYYDNDIAFQQGALQCAEQTILLIDSSKFKKTALMTVSHLSSMDYLVTDQLLSPEVAQQVSEMNINYVHARD